MAVTFRPEDHFEKEEVMDVLNEIANPIELAVWGTSNYFNFGSLIRTSHNFAVRKMWGVDLWQDPNNKTTKPYYKRAAMTSHKWMRQNIHCVTTEEFLEKIEGRNVVAFERREGLQTEDLRSFVWPDEPVLLFGSEGNGVPDDLLERADHIVSIPVAGFVLDFNLAQSAAVGLYDWLLKNG